jgi:hypothetical protein
MNTLPTVAPTTFASDITTLLAIESMFGPSGAAVDPTGIAIAAKFFDAVVNSSKLSFVLAVREDELTATSTKLQGRTNPLFKWLTGPEAQRFSPPEVVLATTLKANYINDRAYIEQLAADYIQILKTDPLLRQKTIKWLESSIDVGGHNLRPTYSYPEEYLAPLRSTIAQELPGFGYANFCYCLDFNSKFLPYFNRAEGPYIGHTIRSITGMRFSPSRFRVSNLPVAICFSDPVSRRLEARKYDSAEEFLAHALKTRLIVQSSGIMSCNYGDRPSLAQGIVEKCSEFFPYLTAIDRNPALPQGAVREAKKVARTALYVWTAEQLALLKYTGHFHLDILTSALAAGAAVSFHAAHSLSRVVVPLVENTVVRARTKTGIYWLAPTGLSAVAVSDVNEPQMVSMNTDVIMVNDAANLEVLADFSSLDS